MTVLLKRETAIGRIISSFLHVAILFLAFIPADAYITCPIPSFRESMGFAASPDGKLYLFGGVSCAVSGKRQSESRDRNREWCRDLYVYIHTYIHIYIYDEIKRP